MEGDWSPVVFIITDSYPTDDYVPAIAEFKQYKWGSVIACANSYAPDDALLKQVTDNVVMVNSRSWGVESVQALFQWIAQSIVACCKSAIETGCVPSFEHFPPLPPEVSLVK